MQNTSKPGGLTPIVLAVWPIWVCAAVEARARFQCPGWHNPSQHLTEYPPLRPHKRKTEIVDIADIVDFLQ